MGVYTTCKFAGVVKKEYRDAINKVATYCDNNEGSAFDVSNKWLSTNVDFMMKFAETPRADFIPNGKIHVWNRETGLWLFETSLINYLDTWEIFCSMATKFMESIDVCVSHREGSDTWLTYTLVNGVFVVAEPQSNEDVSMLFDSFIESNIDKLDFYDLDAAKGVKELFRKHKRYITIPDADDLWRRFSEDVSYVPFLDFTKIGVEKDEKKASYLFLVLCLYKYGIIKDDMAFFSVEDALQTAGYITESETV